MVKTIMGRQRLSFVGWVAILGGREDIDRSLGWIQVYTGSLQ
jgi:hypothetical protein